MHQSARVPGRRPHRRLGMNFDTGRRHSEVNRDAERTIKARPGGGEVERLQPPAWLHGAGCIPAATRIPALPRDQDASTAQGPESQAVSARQRGRHFVGHLSVTLPPRARGRGQSRAWGGVPACAAVCNPPRIPKTATGWTGKSIRADRLRTDPPDRMRMCPAGCSIPPWRQVAARGHDLA